MSNVKATYICFLILMSGINSLAQLQRDQDLITLKNGYQILGYIIEQEPGKLIRIYRPDVPDTVVARYDEITKLTKIWVQTYSEKEVDETVIETVDTIELGRYNNKKNVFHATYMLQVHNEEALERKAFGLGYFKSFENKYWGGLSAYAFRKPNPLFTELHDTGEQNKYIFSQFYFMFENKFRLSHRPQNRRLTTLLSASAGYMVDLSTTTFLPTATELDVEYEKYSDGLVLHGGFCFRVNPDNNSGFMIEPGVTYAPQNVKQYSAPTDEPDAVYLGYYRKPNASFTLKLSYFF
jgi:hypothetical protein